MGAQALKNPAATPTGKGGPRECEATLFDLPAQAVRGGGPLRPAVLGPACWISEFSEPNKPVVLAVASQLGLGSQTSRVTAICQIQTQASGSGFCRAQASKTGQTVAETGPLLSIWSRLIWLGASMTARGTEGLELGGSEWVPDTDITPKGGKGPSTSATQPVRLDGRKLAF